MKSILLLLLTSSLLHAGLVRPLPLLPGDEPSADYEVRVDGKPVPVAFGEFNGGHSFHHAGFEMEGSAKVTVRFPKGLPAAVEILPSRHKLPLKREGQTVGFDLDQTHKLVLKAEGLRPLFLFALPPEVNPPKPGDSKVHYFPAGVHEVGTFLPKSGETIYLEAGAVVKGILHAFEIENLVIRGRGLWDARGLTSKKEKIHAMLFERSKNIRLEGIQLRSGDWWQANFLLSSDIEIEHLRLMSFGKNNDGIDVDGVTNLTARHCFIGCGDDGFGWHAIDAVTLGEPPSRNLLAEDCVIWNERAGNGIRLGASMETSVFENITFRDIDVLHVNKGYAIMMDHSDWGHTRNVLFERLNNESDKPLMFLSTQETWFSNKTGYRNERGKISDLYFHQVTSKNPGVKLVGADAEHGIRDLWFVDCALEGKPLTSAKDFVMNEHVTGLHFVDALPERKIHPAEPAKGRQLAELTIDNGDPGFWAFGGEGQRALEDLAEAVGKDAVQIDQLGWGHAAVYIPELEGRYEIHIHWVSQPGISSKTPWTVHHAEGYSTKVFPNDTTTGWHSLGTFELKPASWVRLVDPHYQISDGPVIADAVRFVRVD
jgi:hypothetical protein